MEFGLTFPLQRFLHRAPSHGADPFHLHCWDCHVIDLRGRKSLLAVHCASRWATVLYDLTPAAWDDLFSTLQTGIRESLLAAGLPTEDADAFLTRGGPHIFSRTHGRRAVAYLNRAWEDVLRQEYALDPASRTQPLLEHALNNAPCRCAGFDGLGRPLERMAVCIKETRI